MNDADRLGMYDAKPPRCENCACPVADGERIVDSTDDGIVYCSPDCMREFIADVDPERHSTSTTKDDGKGWT
jgi:hypothetical protein